MKKASVETTRPPIERMKYIAGLLRAGKAFNVSMVARRFEADPKTIDRDLVFMRDRLGWEFEFDRRSKSYKLRSAPKPVL